MLTSGLTGQTTPAPPGNNTFTLNAVERAALDAFRAGASAAESAGTADTPESWLKFGLHVLLECGRRVRAMRFSPLSSAVVFKEDGSPSVSEEHAIEHYLKDQLQLFAPDTGIVGEESGGAFISQGLVAAIDPVDGTWALVNRSATHATSLAFFRDARVFLGMVANAANGELAYALKGQPSRLIQLPCFGEADMAFDLPLDQSPGQRILVNLQPARQSEQMAAQLHHAWAERKIGMLKTMGGSPSWALLEAAKGTFVYVNRWTVQSAEPFDLAAGVFLLRQAGGEAVDLNNQPIDGFSHRAPFVAGLDRQALQEVAAICQEQSHHA